MGPATKEETGLRKAEGRVQVCTDSGLLVRYSRKGTAEAVSSGKGLRTGLTQIIQGLGSVGEYSAYTGVPGSGHIEHVTVRTFNNLQFATLQENDVFHSRK